MNTSQHQHNSGHQHGHGPGYGPPPTGPDADPSQWFTQEYWDDRYSGESIWSGHPNPLLVRYAAGLAPGTALDVGSGEGADVIWLAHPGLARHRGRHFPGCAAPRGRTCGPGWPGRDRAHHLAAGRPAPLGAAGRPL